MWPYTISSAQHQLPHKGKSHFLSCGKFRLKSPGYHQQKVKLLYLPPVLSQRTSVVTRGFQLSGKVGAVYFVNWTRGGYKGFALFVEDCLVIFVSLFRPEIPRHVIYSCWGGIFSVVRCRCTLYSISFGSVQHTCKEGCNAVFLGGELKYMVDINFTWSIGL